MRTVMSSVSETRLPFLPSTGEACPPAAAFLLPRDSALSGGRSDLATGGHGADRHRRETILLVDDEPTVLAVLKIALEKSGFRVVVASNGAEALAKFEAMQDQIRVVITDVAMPGMNGLDLICSLRKFVPAVDIVATTGMTTQSQMKAIREAGASHILSKPCGSRQMIELIRNLFSKP